MAAFISSVYHLLIWLTVVNCVAVPGPPKHHRLISRDPNAVEPAYAYFAGASVKYLPLLISIIRKVC